MVPYHTAALSHVQEFESTIELKLTPAITILEYKYTSIESTPSEGLSAWLTARCSEYEAGLFAFWTGQSAHGVALTMCQQEVIVCDYGVCMPIKVWLEEGLTTVTAAELVLYRQRRDTQHSTHSTRHSTA